MPNSDRELQFLKTIKDTGILDLGRFQLVKGNLLINDTENKFKYDKVIEYYDYGITKEDFIQSIVDPEKYYLLQMYDIHVEKDKGAMYFKSATKAVKMGIAWMDGFEKVFEKWLDKDISTEETIKEDMNLTSEHLKERIEMLIELVKNDISLGIDISGKFTYAIRCFYLNDDYVVTFGGYAMHYEIYGLDTYDVEEIVEKFEEYINSYEGDKLENCTECPIANEDTLMC